MVSHFVAFWHLLFLFSSQGANTCFQFLLTQQTVQFDCSCFFPQSPTSFAYQVQYQGVTVFIWVLSCDSVLPNRPSFKRKTRRPGSPFFFLTKASSFAVLLCPPPLPRRLHILFLMSAFFLLVVVTFEILSYEGRLILSIQNSA